MLKGVSISIFLAGCLALYLAVLMLINPTVPGATAMIDARIAYSITIVVLALVCCAIAGLTWSHASKMRASTAVMAALALSTVFLVVVCMQMGLGDQIPL